MPTIEFLKSVLDSLLSGFMELNIGRGVYPETGSIERIPTVPFLQQLADIIDIITHIVKAFVTERF